MSWPGSKRNLSRAIENANAAKIAPEGGKNGSDLNARFFKTLRDLLAPSPGNARKNAPLSAAAATRLFEIATAHGLEREAIRAQLECCQPGAEPPSLYDFRRLPTGDLYGLYPQVEFLLGQRVTKAKTHPKKGLPKKRGDLAVEGKLQRLFSNCSTGSGPRRSTCVVEVARDLPRNQKQKDERSDRIAENEHRRKQLFVKYGVADDGKRGTRDKLERYDQQGGLCPFTGEELPKPGTKEYEHLQDEHLYPQSWGGLTVNENLVLVGARVNHPKTGKGQRTPRQYAAEVLGVPFERLLEITAKMRWGTTDRDLDTDGWKSFKRAVFAWETPKEIPPFGNTTRVAQLARQLLAQAAYWMRCTSAEEQAERIGNPTGFQTSACRRAWGLVEKDREDLTHHLVDAIILAHIHRAKDRITRTAAVSSYQSSRRNIGAWCSTRSRLARPLHSPSTVSA